jgi:hypothetical protein
MFQIRCGLLPSGTAHVQYNAIFEDIFLILTVFCSTRRLKFAMSQYGIDLGLKMHIKSHHLIAQLLSQGAVG